MSSSSSNRPDSIESIEAAAWHDIYRAAPAHYAQDNMLGTTKIGRGACLAHGKLVVPELARVVGLTSLPEIHEATTWMDEYCPPGWALQLPPTPEHDAARQALVRAGFAPQGNGWAKFRRDASAVETAAIPQLRSSLAQLDDAATFAQLISGGFGFPESLGQWFSSLVGRPDWSVLIAYWGDQPVGCGAIYTANGYSWMGVDATLPEFRGRGVQSHLIRARLRLGIALGVNEFTAETGQPDAGMEAQHHSFSNYLRAGFTHAYVRPNYVKGASTK